MRRILITALAAALALAGCSLAPSTPEGPELTPAQARAIIQRALPANLADAAGWTTDIYAAFAVQRIPVTPSNACAVVAITEQESSFRANPTVPNLPAIAWAEIDRQARSLGIPAMLARAALQLESPNGKTYAERIDAARTEQDLSRVFDDFVGMVPMGKRLFGDRNPVRTGGPMQVGIAFAQAYAADHPYPYPVSDGIRQEVFSRRGGMYFGIAHLLDYPVTYDRPLYRFADYNAGHYASRNAAFQNAVSIASGVPLQLDGDLVGVDASRPGPTETAVRVLARELDMSDSSIRRALEQEKSPGFERSILWTRVFAIAERREGQSLPRAVLPRIELRSPKITRSLTTEWFANRVNERHQRCMARVAGA